MHKQFYSTTRHRQCWVTATHSAENNCWIAFYDLRGILARCTKSIHYQMNIKLAALHVPTDQAI